MDSLTRPADTQAVADPGCVPMGAFHRIRTWHGTWLGVEDATGRIACRTATQPDVEPHILVGYVSPLRPKVCFLLARSAGVDRLHLPPGLTCTAVLPLGLAPAAAAPTVSLYDPDTGRWLCAAPARDGSGIGSVDAVRDVIQWYETYTLLPVSGGQVPPEGMRLAWRLDALLAATLDVETILALEPEDGPLLDAVARLLPRVELQVLAGALLASPDACRALARLFPDDPFATIALPSLATWVTWRDVADGALQNWQMTLDVDADALARIGADGDAGTLAYRCNALARRMVQPRRDACIIATVRNEGLYLLDWIAYHRALGVDEFFLYSNDNDDGSDALLAALARAEVIHWVDNRMAAGGVQPQQKAYAHALAVRPDVLDFRWALLIDADEYFVLDPSVFTSLQDFLRWQEAAPVDAIALNWMFQGSCRQAEWRDEPVVRRFPTPVFGPDSAFKTILRPQHFIRSGPHYPQTFRHDPFIFMNARAAPHVRHASVDIWSETPCADHAWINHYYYKSTQEFLLRWSRNGAHEPVVKGHSTGRLTARRVRRFAEQFLMTGPARVDPAGAVPGFAAELADLMALPGVADAFTQVRQWFAARTPDLIRLFQDSPAIREAGEAGQALLATLGPPPVRGWLCGPDIALPPGSAIGRMATDWGTVVFADVYLNRLRHGPAGAVPDNVAVAIVGDSAWLLYTAPDGRRHSIDLQPERHGRPADDTRHEASALRVVPAAAGSAFALRRDDLFVCADDLSFVTLSRRVLGPWEQFRIAGSDAR